MYRARHNSPPLVNDRFEEDWRNSLAQHKANRLFKKSDKTSTKPVIGWYIGENVYISFSSKPLPTSSKDCASNLFLKF